MNKNLENVICSITKPVKKLQFSQPSLTKFKFSWLNMAIHVTKSWVKFGWENIIVC